MRCTICGERLDRGQDQPMPATAACRRCGGRLRHAEFLLAAPATSSPLAAFAFGIQAYLDGIRFSFVQRRLRRWCLAPLAIALVIFVAAAVPCFELLHGLPERWLSSEWWAFLDWLRGPVNILLSILIYPLILLIALLVSYVLTSVITSPICDHLSALTEELILGVAPARKRSLLAVLSQDVYQPIVQSLKLALFQLAASLLLLLVSLVTGGLATPIAMLTAAYFAALMANDYPLARKGYTLSEKLRYQNAHLAEHLGFGLAAYLLPFLLPCAAVGATRSFLALQPK